MYFIIVQPGGWTYESVRQIYVILLWKVHFYYYSFYYALSESVRAVMMEVKYKKVSMISSCPWLACKQVYISFQNAARKLPGNCIYFQIWVLLSILFCKGNNCHRLQNSLHEITPNLPLLLTTRLLVLSSFTFYDLCLFDIKS